MRIVILAALMAVHRGNGPAGPSAGHARVLALLG